MKKLGILSITLLFIAFISKIILFDISPVPLKSDINFHLAQARQMASKGKLPTSLHSLVIAEAIFPKTGVVAGAGFSDQSMTFSSFQVNYADKSQVIIDCAYDKTMHDKMSKGKPFHEKNYTAMQSAMAKAKYIIFTHEHNDHMGGLAKSDNFSNIKQSVLITSEQKKSKDIKRTGFSEEQLNSLKPFDYTDFTSPAPGIVVIKAAGHSAGSQLVFVRLANGVEFLFIGDIAWNMDNITNLTGKPLLMNLLFLNEDRPIVAKQLRTLYDMQNVQRENINIIVAHDPAQLRKYNENNLIVDGFR